MPRHRWNGPGLADQSIRRMARNGNGTGPTPGFDTTPEGALIRFVKGYAGKIESERIKERVARGKAARLASGKIPAQRSPIFGYRWTPDKGAYTIDPEKADVVRRIFDLVLQGQPL